MEHYNKVCRNRRRAKLCIYNYQSQAIVRRFNRRVVRKRCIEKQQRFYESVLQKSLETVEILSHTKFENPLVQDPYLDLLASGQDHGRDEVAALNVLLTTRYLDDCVIKCLESMPDIKQVVLLGTSFDTRPYRIPFPRGTIVFDIAPKNIQEYKTSKLKDSSICSGCLHLQVSIPVEKKMQKVDELLARRGYQGSKPSIWVLQNMESYCSTKGDIEDTLDSVANLMSMNSIIIGSHANISQNVFSNLLAGCSLHGDCFPGRRVLQSYQPESTGVHEGREEVGKDEDLIVFSGMQTRRSVAETDLYKAHTEAVEEVDEDYFDNIV